MNKRLSFFLLIWITLSATICWADKNEKIPQHWSIRAGYGTGEAEVESPENQNFYTGENSMSNIFFVNGDYFLTKHLALSGGFYYEEAGLLADYAKDIGLMKFNCMGLTAGTKYYFLPRKWIVQAYAGGFVQTNFLNITHQVGERKLIADNMYPGSMLYVKYDVKRPFISVAPQFGLDIRIISSVSLCLGIDMRIPLGGHQRADMRFINGPLMGQTSSQSANEIKFDKILSVKVAFPLKPVKESTVNNIIEYLIYYFSTQ